MKTVVAFSVSRAEADNVRAARGFQSFKIWGEENRKASSEHRKNKKGELADALDREYEMYIRRNI